ncbi:MAG: HAD family hydrolase, partial [Candidatus Kariarchaeaceae archaeon]
MEQAHLILFDIDGTLVDSNEAILEAFRIAHKTIGREYPGDEMISSKFGKSLMPILEELKIPESDLDDFVHAFRNAELESTQFSLFGGMREVLDLVKQLTGTLAAVTSKSQVTANHVLETLNLSEEFTLVITADDVE